MDLKYYKQYCEDIENVENFDKAKADNFKSWCCHHRKGEFIPAVELITLEQYYNVSADELIFLPESEHKSLHQKGNQHSLGKKHSSETREKQSEAHKGKKLSDEHKKHLSEAKKGKPQSEEHRKKNSESHKGQLAWNKGKKMSEDFRKKVSENNRGLHWYNNSEIEIKAKECPLGYGPGRLKRK